MVSLDELAALLNAQLLLPDSAHRETIRGVSSAATADSRSVVFAESAAALAEALASDAGAVIASNFIALPAVITKPLLLVRQPRLAFAAAARLLRVERRSAGVHSTAVVASTARLGTDISVGPYAVIGENTRIGDRTRIAAGCVLGDGTEIGADCVLHPRVVVYAGASIGSRVVIHAGAVLGSDGFGYVLDADTGAYTQFPQQGTLVIEDDVEIGANTAIDRGALTETRIARGAKLDNLIHIGHNVSVGRNVVVAAQTGISGSSSVGDGAILGGQVGVGEHAEIGPDVILGGGAGVLSRKKLRGRGQVFWGRPAQPLRAYLRSLAALARLAEKPKD